MQTLLNINSILVPYLERDLPGMTLELTQSINPDLVTLLRSLRIAVEESSLWIQQREIFPNSYNLQGKAM